MMDAVNLVKNLENKILELINEIRLAVDKVQEIDGINYANVYSSYLSGQIQDDENAATCRAIAWQTLSEDAHHLLDDLLEIQLEENNYYERKEGNSF